MTRRKKILFSISFAILSGLVLLTLRNRFFVDKKLRLGAWFLSAVGLPGGYARTTCYAPAMDFEVNVDTIPDSLIHQAGDEIRLKPMWFESPKSYSIVTAEGTVVERKDLPLMAHDSDLVFRPTKPTKPGRYRLTLHSLPRDSTTPDSNVVKSIALQVLRR